MDIGIDLGTASILVYVKDKGVVLKEPSVVAFDRDTNRIKAIGEEARLMLGRTPGNIVAVRPLRQGVISDYTVTEKMLKYFIQKAVGKQRFRKPLISICVPSGVTEVERKAVEDATFQAGARDVKIIEEPIAAAIGAGIDIARPCGNMIVDIGGGTSDIAVISLGGTVAVIARVTVPVVAVIPGTAVAVPVIPAPGIILVVPVSVAVIAFPVLICVEVVVQLENTVSVAVVGRRHQKPVRIVYCL